MPSIFNRLNTFLLVMLVFMAGAIIAILASRASAGPLDPPGAPASTMHTLGDTPPSWDQVLDSTNGAPGGGPPGSVPAGCNSDRFKCVMVYKTCITFTCTVYPAVLDEETGLVWQRSPDTITTTWGEAVVDCTDIATDGNRGGWRLPTMAELSSLWDGSGKTLPAGNPFTNVQTAPGASYWTSTELVDAPTNAFIIGFPAEGYEAKTNLLYRWCVRGATGDR
jgi:Protein of unknown function (DUF1566)